MKISIITVSLNEKDTIETTFSSVLNQTYKDFELIVVDGGSTDGTLEIIDKYKDKISHFISEPDNGIYDAMNKGIDLATGDFLLFLNANDKLYDDNVFQLVADTLNKNPEMKLLFGDVEMVSAKESEKRIKYFGNITNYFSLLRDNICHQSVFYHKSLFENFGKYSAEYRICSDWDFNIKCLVKNKVKAVYLPAIISEFSLDGVSSNFIGSDKFNIERRKLLKKYYSVLRFVLFADNYFSKHCKIYPKIRKTKLVIKFVDMFCSQKIFKLDVLKN